MSPFLLVRSICLLQSFAHQGCHKGLFAASASAVAVVVVVLVVAVAVVVAVVVVLAVAAVIAGVDNDGDEDVLCPRAKQDVLSSPYHCFLLS